MIAGLVVGLIVGFVAPSSTATLRASMTRDISPPDAISWSGFSGSPGLVAMRYSTASHPCGVHAASCSSGATAISNLTFMASELIWVSASFGEFGCRGLALLRHGVSSRAIGLCGTVELGAQGLQDFVAVFNFSKFAGDIFAESDDLGD